VIRSEKKLRELSAVLSKHNKEQICEAIKSLRNEESCEGIIRLLVSYYDKAEEKMVLRTIEEFFNDLKDQAVRIEVVAELRKTWKTSTIDMLIASCWQSGLDYSDYLRDFAKIFLKGDYSTAIECMTVIEESNLNSSRERKDEIISLIMESPLSHLNDKADLAHELILILER
jgi:hypothetical protein